MGVDISMSERPSESETPPHPDVDTIRKLVKLMSRYDLSAIDLIDSNKSIRLRRRGADVQPVAPVASEPAAAPRAVPAAKIPAQVEPPVAEAESFVIRSPMVGTFYSSSSPEAAPYVSVGSVVRPDTTVCVIEAMKVFTEIPAGTSGTIAAVLVKNGQAVEFDQPLFRVSP
jgi:acetyl-CoA carboxylase biotin carboxyl carrier protein